MTTGSQLTSSMTTTSLRASPTAVGVARGAQGYPDLVLIALLIIPIVFMFWIWVLYHSSS